MRESVDTRRVGKAAAVPGERGAEAPEDCPSAAHPPSGESQGLSTRPNADYWDSIVRQWSETRGHSLWRRHADAVNRDLIARWLPKSGIAHVLKTDLFDEAVGEGLYPLLSTRAARVSAIDLSPACRDSAHARYPELEPVAADVLDLPFPDNTFDAVVSCSTLDHFESHGQILSALKELHRTLRPGGHLLLTMDNPVNPAVRLRNALPREPLIRLGVVPYYVGITWGPRRLRNRLREVGMEVLETTAIMHCPRILAVVGGGRLDRRSSERARERYLRILNAFERLERLPTRGLTGYFVAIKAVKTHA